VRVLLDTNVLLSALLVRGTPPDRLYEAWRQGRFDLVSCERQLEELNRVSRRPVLRERLRPAEAGRLVNEIRRLAILCEPVNVASISPDPDDDFLLAVAEAAHADYLVTGDKTDLLSLGRYRATRILTARELVELLAG
jgi:putative PIN family toxin of toxin-antitoxin system